LRQVCYELSRSYDKYCEAQNHRLRLPTKTLLLHTDYPSTHTHLPKQTLYLRENNSPVPKLNLVTSPSARPTTPPSLSDHNYARWTTQVLLYCEKNPTPGSMFAVRTSPTPEESATHLHPPRQRRVRFLSRQTRYLRLQGLFPLLFPLAIRHSGPSEGVKPSYLVESDEE